ncbi:hypothetical protein K1719_011629 [Acacia pycnantha]|nr:hypothetical protein K1719_011629 [Acacia pycnantha]
MGDLIVVPIDPLVILASLQSPHDADAQLLSSEGSNSQIADICTSDVHVVAVGGFETSDDENLVQKVECHICQEEDSLGNMDTPCACRGTIKFAHWRCVQRRCNEKGDTICEICRQPYKPSYRPYHPEVASNSIRTGWTISHATLDLHDPQTLAIQHWSTMFLKLSMMTMFTVAWALITLLILRHAASLINADVEKALAYFSFILFRAAAFVLPFYLMARTIRLILTQRQRLLAAAELEFMLHHGLQFATSPVPALRL